MLSDSLYLGIISFFTSTVTAVVGLGGGILLISFMPGFLPLSALIPIHGVVQLSSNASRALVLVKYLKLPLLTAFVFGSCIGAIAGGFVLPFFNWKHLPILLGVIILALTWIPKPKKPLPIPGKFFSIGAIQTFLSLFVGFAGPLNTPLLIREGLNKDEIVVTHASQMTFLHLIKICTFGILGFSFTPYFQTLLLMIFGAILGSIFGTKIRSKVSENLFLKLLKVLITVLSLRMIFNTS